MRVCLRVGVGSFSDIQDLRAAVRIVATDEVRIVGMGRTGTSGAAVEFRAAVPMEQGKYSIEAVAGWRGKERRDQAFVASVLYPFEVGAGPVNLAMFDIRLRAPAMVSSDHSLPAAQLPVSWTARQADAPCDLPEPNDARQASESIGGPGAKQHKEPGAASTQHLQPPSTALSKSAQLVWTRYERLPRPKALAMDATQNVHGMATGLNAIRQAMKTCADGAASRTCRLYSIDDTVVWNLGQDLKNRAPIKR